MANYTLDIRKHARQFTATGLRAGDNGLRTFYFHFTDGGEAFFLPSGCVATLFARLPDGVSVYDSCEVLGDTVIYTLKGGSEEASITALPGKVDCEIRLTAENGRVLTSPSFSIIIDPILQDDGAVEAQESFSALTDALGRVLESEEGLAKKIDRAEATEGNAAVFTSDGAVKDFGSPPIKQYRFIFDYVGNGSYDEENFNTFCELYRDHKNGCPYFPVITYEKERVPASINEYSDSDWRIASIDPNAEYNFIIRIRFTESNDGSPSMTRIIYSEKKLSSGTSASGTNGSTYTIPYYSQDSITSAYAAEISSVLEKISMDAKDFSLFMRVGGELLPASLSDTDSVIVVSAQSFCGSPMKYSVTKAAGGTVTTSEEALFAEDLESAPDNSAPSSAAVKNYILENCESIVDAYLKESLNGDEVSY